MKDYSITKEESKTFIVDVEETYDKIIVYYADGHTQMREKTREEFDKVMSILKCQINHSDRKVKEINNHMASNIKLLLYTISLFLLLLCILGNYGLSGIPFLLTPLVIYSCCSLKNDRNILSDIRKHKTFLEHQTEILNAIKEHQVVLTNTTLKTQEIVKNEELNPTEFLEDEPINLINLEEISESDLNLILENIEDLNSLGYVTPEREDKVMRFRPNKRR